MISILLDRIVSGVRVETIDLTRKLDDQSKLAIRNELERDMFELTVPDVDIRLSDLDESLYNKFFNEPISTIWKTHILNNGSAKFRGFVNNDYVKRDMNGEYISITSFSTLKKFWEVAEKIKIWEGPANPIEYSTGYYSLLDFINIYINYGMFGLSMILKNADFDRTILIRSTTLFQTGTKDAAISITYPNMSIFDTGDTTVSNGDPNWVGNRVRMGLLHNTLKELLIAVAKKNNMEWYIDPVTESLKLAQRNAIRNDLGTDLSDKVIDSDSIEVSFSDEKKYDYVSVIVPFNPLNIPIYNGGTVLPEYADVITLDKPGRPCGFYEYILAIVDINDKVLSCGQILSVTSPIVPPLPQPGKNPPTIYGLTALSFTIPELQDIPLIKKRRLYRRCIASYGGGLDEKFYNGNFLFVAEFDGNSSVNFVDNESDKSSLIRALKSTPENNYTLDVSNTVSSTPMLISYDETVGRWNTPIRESDYTSQIGKVFETKVSLSFGDVVSGEIHEATTEEIYHFFGGNVELAKLQEYWKDLMLTKRRIPLTMMGNDLQIGDAFTLKQITKLKGINKLVVKKVTEDLTSEESQLELITV